MVQKIGIKGAEVPPADFLLETDKRGTPPKSEKRWLLARHLKNSWGERGRGAALFAKKLANLRVRESQILRICACEILQIYLFWLIRVGKRGRTLLLAKTKSSKSFYALRARFWEFVESRADSGSL